MAANGVSTELGVDGGSPVSCHRAERAANVPPARISARGVQLFLGTRARDSR